MAVSYTHLDVYKRQDLQYLKVKMAYEAGRESAVKSFFEKAHLMGMLDSVLTYDQFLLYCRYAAVSYTHLDVYKRQAQPQALYAHEPEPRGVRLRVRRRAQARVHRTRARRRRMGTVGRGPCGAETERGGLCRMASSAVHAAASAGSRPAHARRRRCV